MKPPSPGFFPLFIPISFLFLLGSFPLRFCFFFFFFVSVLC